MTENKIKFTLKMPPSVNTAYSGYRIRHKSEVYKNYQREVSNFYENHDIIYKISGDNWLEVKYIFYFSLFTKDGKKRIKDVGNYEKTLSDVLSKNIEGFKDEKIKILYLEKIDSDEEKVEIEIKEI